MKCKCGNETGKPVVNPGKTGVLYMAGFDEETGKCWFCVAQVLGLEDFEICRQKARDLGLDI